MHMISCFVFVRHVLRRVDVIAQLRQQRRPPQESRQPPSYPFLPLLTSAPYTTLRDNASISYLLVDATYFGTYSHENCILLTGNQRVDPKVHHILEMEACCRTNGHLS
jgi:hypothetical protein